VEILLLVLGFIVLPPLLGAWAAWRAKTPREVACHPADLTLVDEIDQPALEAATLDFQLEGFQPAGDFFYSGLTNVQLFRRAFRSPHEPGILAFLSWITTADRRKIAVDLTSKFADQGEVLTTDKPDATPWPPPPTTHLQKCPLASFAELLYLHCEAVDQRTRRETLLPAPDDVLAFLHHEEHEETNRLLRLGRHKLDRSGRYCRPTVRTALTSAWRLWLKMLVRYDHYAVKRPPRRLVEAASRQRREALAAPDELPQAIALDDPAQVDHCPEPALPPGSGDELGDLRSPVSPGESSPDTPIPAPPSTSQRVADPLGFTRRDALQKQCHQGARWFYWIAGLSLLNSVAFLAGSQRVFVIGLGITQIMDACGATLGPLGKAVALLFDVTIAGGLAALGYFAARGRGWAFVVGLTAYAFDTLVLLAASLVSGAAFWMPLVFHGLGLWWIARGYHALRQARDPARPNSPTPFLQENQHGQP